ncbi:MAG: hypothetical protein ACI9K1_002824 [Arcticibacterium sp.]|jgi:hypothetical protein
MKIVLLTLVALFILNCGMFNKNSKLLLGKWDNSYQIRQKDSIGVWSEWQTINTFVALPQLEFTANGKILWDGKLVTECGLFLSYQLVKDEIELSATTPSERCNYTNCQKWEIEKLTDEVLEMNSCDSKVRYFRAQ